MSSLAVSGIVFACVYTGTLLGMLLRAILPDHHLSSESKDVLKLGMGLIGTMGALVLGLMVGSAKGSYDTQRAEVTQISAKVILLDRVLSRFGPEAKDARERLRTAIGRVVELTWPEAGSKPPQLDPMSSSGEPVYEAIQQLEPTNEGQRSLKAQALSLAYDIGNIRWLLFQQSGSSISLPFLVVLVFWFTVIFMGFGLFSPPNFTVIATLLLCAVSVATALLLVLEMDRPFEGLIQISADPLRKALAVLGK